MITNNEQIHISSGSGLDYGGVLLMFFTQLLCNLLAFSQKTYFKKLEPERAEIRVGGEKNRTSLQHITGKCRVSTPQIALH